MTKLREREIRVGPFISLSLSQSELFPMERDSMGRFKNQDANVKSSARQLLKHVARG